MSVSQIIKSTGEISDQNLSNVHKQLNYLRDPYVDCRIILKLHLRYNGLSSCTTLNYSGSTQRGIPTHCLPTQFQVKQFLTYAGKEWIKTRIDFFLEDMKAYWDLVDGRILLGDDRQRGGHAAAYQCVVSWVSVQIATQCTYICRWPHVPSSYFRRTSGPQLLCQSEESLYWGCLNHRSSIFSWTILYFDLTSVQFV